jgi:hypothetical protein
MNVEFVLVLDTHGKGDVGVDELLGTIDRAEVAVLENHPESQARDERQLAMFEGDGA